jgi:hypothetical protein
VNRRLFILLPSLPISLLALLLSFVFIATFQQGVPQNVIGGDTSLPIQGASVLIRGGDPYTSQLDVSYKNKPIATYPLTTMIALVSFSFLGPVLGGCLFFSCSVGLLVFALLTKGPRWRFFLFASGAFLQAFTYIQFSPLIASILLLPALAPLALMKPQIGLPVLLHKLTWWKILSALAFLAISFIIMPDWPLRWFRTAQNYDGFIPILTLPFGPLLILSLLNL